MKLFNVQIQVTITDLGELQEPEPSLSESIDFSGDPLKAQAQMLETFANLSTRAIPSKLSYYPGSAESGMSMAETVKIAAGSFEELQSILKKFHDTAQSLSIESVR